MLAARASGCRDAARRWGASGRCEPLLTLAGVQLGVELQRLVGTAERCIALVPHSEMRRGWSTDCRCSWAAAVNVLKGMLCRLCTPRGRWCTTAMHCTSSPFWSTLDGDATPRTAPPAETASSFSKRGASTRARSTLSETNAFAELRSSCVLHPCPTTNPFHPTLATPHSRPSRSRCCPRLATAPCRATGVLPGRASILARSKSGRAAPWGRAGLGQLIGWAIAVMALVAPALRYREKPRCRTGSWF